jgi:hypothetical protein
MHLSRAISLLLLCASAALAQDAPPAPSDSAPPKAKVSVLPVLGSAPETGLQYGVALFATKAHAVEGTRPSSLISNAIRTAKGQTRVFVDIDRWTAQNNWRFGGVAIWQQFPLPFYGIGDRTEEDDKELYTPRGTELNAFVQRRIARARWVQVALRRNESALIRTEAGGQLEPGTLPGSRGGRTVIASASLIADARDNLFAPTRGHFMEFVASRADAALGSDFDFTRLRADLRTYRAAPFIGGGHLLALQFVAQGITSEAPFDQRSPIGSPSIMRGYVPGRFRDDWMMAGQAEFRSYIAGSWGYALFAGAGAVAPTLPEISDARILPSIGGGLRFRMDPKTGATIRVDYARGTRGQSGLYVSFNEAF